MILTQGGLTQPNNPVSFNPNYPPTAAYRRPGLEFIRTVKLSDQDYTAVGTPWRLNRVDIDVEGAPFTRYKEILFSFNGGFSPNGTTEAYINVRKQGALVSAGTFYYNFKDITASTPTVNYTATSTTGALMAVTSGFSVSATVQTLDVYISQMGLRGETHMLSDGAIYTVSMPRFNMRFPTQTTPDNFTYQFFENESPGLTLYVGTPGTNFLRTPYYVSGLTSGNFPLISNFECNIYGFVR